MRRSVSLSDEGVDRVQKMLGIKNLFTPEYVRTVYHLDQALKAQVVFQRDKDYVVTNDGEVSRRAHWSFNAGPSL